MTREELEAVAEQLNLSPTEMARAMGIPYDTYKDLGKRRDIQPIHERVICLLKAVRYKKGWSTLKSEILAK